MNVFTENTVCIGGRINTCSRYIRYSTRDVSTDNDTILVYVYAEYFLHNLRARSYYSIAWIPKQKGAVG